MKLELIFLRNYDERLESVNYVNIYFFLHPCYHYVLVPGADISKAGGDFLPWVFRDDYNVYESFATFGEIRDSEREKKKEERKTGKKSATSRPAGA